MSEELALSELVSGRLNPEANQKTEQSAGKMPAVREQSEESREGSKPGRLRRLRLEKERRVEVAGEKQRGEIALPSLA